MAGVVRSPGSPLKDEGLSVHYVAESLCITGQCLSLIHLDLSNTRGATHPRDMLR